MAQDSHADAAIIENKTILREHLADKQIEACNLTIEEITELPMKAAKAYIECFKAKNNLNIANMMEDKLKKTKERVDREMKMAQDQLDGQTKTESDMGPEFFSNLYKI